jgi:hypothetical protein
MGRRLRQFLRAIAVSSALMVPSSTLAQEPASSSTREAFEPTDSSIVRQSFAERFPEGKWSVVEETIDGTDSLLTAAHRLALRADKERGAYREALVYQAAASDALDDERFAEAMYLTLHARALAEDVIRADTVRIPVEARPGDLERIRRAGGVDASEVEAYLDTAEDGVPAVELLFVEKSVGP